CDNAGKCGEYLSPYEDGYVRMIFQQEQGVHTSFIRNRKPQQKKAARQPEPEPVYFDSETFRQTLGDYDKNTFIQNLRKTVPFPFQPDEVTEVVKTYELGTAPTGALTIPFIDNDGNVR